jgi:hypothetical protein
MINKTCVHKYEHGGLNILRLFVILFTYYYTARTTWTKKSKISFSFHYIWKIQQLKHLLYILKWDMSECFIYPIKGLSIKSSK